MEKADEGLSFSFVQPAGFRARRYGIFTEPAYQDKRRAFKVLAFDFNRDIYLSRCFMSDMTLSTHEPSSAHDVPRVWTFADLVSTYRYWALFIAVALMALALGPTMLVISASGILGRDFSSVATTGMTLRPYIMAIMLIVAFVSPPHGIKWTLVFLILLDAVAVLCLKGGDLSRSFSSFSLLDYFSALILYLSYISSSFSFSMMQFSVLMTARSSKVDFIAAYGLLVMTPAVLLTISIQGFTWILNHYHVGIVRYVMFGCFPLAAIALLLSRSLSFDQPPRVRHTPLAYRRRWAAGVTLAAILPVVIALILLWIALMTMLSTPWRAVDGRGLALLALLLVLCSLIYIGYWCYRIHGELADRAPSQQLLTPVAAAVMAMFVPLALPILLITLGRIVNTRGAAVSIGWLSFWSLVMPPIAMGMVQNAANVCCESNV